MKVMVVNDAGVQTEAALEKVTIRGTPLSDYLKHIKDLEEEVKKLRSETKATVKSLTQSFEDTTKALKAQFVRETERRDRENLELEQRFLKVWRSVK